VITEGSTVRLRLDSRPQALTIVRGMLSGVAEQLAIDPELLDDLKTAVSEACNNVVLHAYAGAPGPMTVALSADERRVEVTVTDEGVGLPAAPELADLPQGIGLSVIRALTAGASISALAGGGTEVRMGFGSQRDGRPLLRAPPPPAPDDGVASTDDGEIVVSLSPVTLLPGVLGRLARALAATAHFSLDRFSDVYLVTDTLAAHAASAAAGERISARLSARDRRLEMAVGPFRPGTGSRLEIRTGGHAASPLVLLSDEVSVVEEGGAERLVVVVIDHRR
jgi:anti-sigma regulatory factor (Ser/Thr protein kinase)